MYSGSHQNGDCRCTLEGVYSKQKTQIALSSFGHSPKCPVSTDDQGMPVG